MNLFGVSNSNFLGGFDYRFMEPLMANVPTMMVAGEHEIEPQSDNNLTFVAYSSRFAFPSNESSSFSPLYYSFNAGGAHFIVLNSHTPYDNSCKISPGFDFYSFGFELHQSVFLILRISRFIRQLISIFGFKAT